MVAVVGEMREAKMKRCHMIEPLDHELRPYLEVIGSRTDLRHPLVQEIDYAETRNGYLNRIYREKDRLLEKALAESRLRFLHLAA